jgi:hypothetical protein
MEKSALTLTEMTNRLGCTAHRVKYCAEKKLKLKPRAWAGHCKIYDEEQFKKVKASLGQEHNTLAGG